MDVFGKIASAILACGTRANRVSHGDEANGATRSSQNRTRSLGLNWLSSSHRICTALYRESVEQVNA